MAAPLIPVATGGLFEARHGTLYHTGMVIDDLEAAMADFSAAFGYHWAEPARVAGPVMSPAGEVHREHLVTYSLEGPHHLELLQLVDGTAWRSATGGPYLNHIGIVVDDIAVESERLHSLGFRRELAGVDATGCVAGSAYHFNHHGGVWIELVSTSGAEMLRRWMQGGDPPIAPIRG